MVRHGLIRATDVLLPLAAAAAVLALVAPSTAVAERSDVLLAALVLFTALTIAPSELAKLGACKAEVAALVLVPFAMLVPLSWVAGRPFDGAVPDGVLALGVTSTEVAAVGMVALAGGRTAVALGALTGSLVLAALTGPPLLGLLAGAGGDVAVGGLVGRFVLVVIVPLAGGLAVRAAAPRLRHAEDELHGLAAMTLVVLVYGAMSAAGADGDLLAATAAGTLFLLLSAIPVAAWMAISPSDLRLTGGFVIGLRDFAVAAALASQAFGPPAATVAGVYGVLMLLVGAASAQLPRRRYGPGGPRIRPNARFSRGSCPRDDRQLEQGADRAAAEHDRRPRAGGRARDRRSVRSDRRSGASMPGLRDALWEFMRPMLSPTLVALNRDSFLIEHALDTTVDLDAHHAETTLDELDLDTD